jgi:glycosyltransferase involved in cell wall biosynthesis
MFQKEPTLQPQQPTPHAAPRISVLLPVYNAERYVAAAVQSILDQTFPDFEVILINDGSTDGSLAILERFAALDPRIRLVSRENRGLVETLNEGVSLARGEYIARMDADDIALPERFARQLAYMDAHPECVALGCRIYVIDCDGAPLRAQRRIHCTHEEMDAAQLQGKPGVIMHPTAMIRRDALRRINGYRQPLEDFDLWLRLAEVGKLANLPEILLHYRLHPASMSYESNTQTLTLRQQLVCEAHARRGLAVPVGFAAPSIDGKPLDYSFRCAYAALSGGNTRVALKHAWRAVRRNPGSSAAWRLLARVGTSAIGIP